MNLPQQKGAQNLKRPLGAVAYPRKRLITIASKYLQHQIPSIDEHIIVDHLDLENHLARRKPPKHALIAVFCFTP